MRILPFVSPRRVLKVLCFLGLLLCASSCLHANAQSSCVSGSGTCSDSFTSNGVIASLTDYSSSWRKLRGTADAYTTGNNTIAISGTNYAYYGFAPSTSDVSQITVTASATKNYYAREACVRLTTTGGYCVGFGAATNGSYAGCYIERAGQYLGNGGCSALSSTVNHTLAIAATGTTVVSLDVYVDGVRTGTVVDNGPTYTAGLPGLAMVGDGTPANSQINDWQDYQGASLSTRLLVATPAFACTSGSGTCYDDFQGQSNTSLPQYNSAWVKTKASGEALLTGARSIQVSGSSYAYYWYDTSTSDTSQITITPAAPKQAYTREACVRLQKNGLGYCAGFGAAANGVYSGCYIEKGGQYLTNVSCGTPSSIASHTLTLTASGTLPVVLQVYVDGVPMRAAADYVPLAKSHPGIGMWGDGTPANSDLSAWRDYREVATAVAPSFSPAAGTYSGAQKVAISSPASNAIIHYTTDGSTPTAVSPVYSSPVTVASSLTLKALSMVYGQTTSAVSSATYQITLPAAASPTFTVGSPYSGLATQVGIVNPAGSGQVQYCIDTTNTCTPSVTYTSPILFASTEYIRARSIVTGYSPSAIAVWQGTWSTVHLTTTTCPAGTQYQTYAGCALQASGGLPPYTYSWSKTSYDGMPEGLTINPQTGVISGTVYGQGTYWTYYSVTDGTNTTVSQVIGIAVKGDNTLGGCSMFPSDSIWHLNVANLPVDTSPAGSIAPVYQPLSLRVVFGPNLGDGGIPFLRVPYNQPSVSVATTDFQSYFTSGPFPWYAPVEGTVNSTADRHVSVLQTGGNGSHCKLWEMYRGVVGTSGAWTDSSNAYWDLDSYDMLPQDNGSTDAAGLPVAPLLYTYDEVAGNCAAGAECGEVKHPGRLTLNHTLNYHVWPATAQSGLGYCIGGYQDYNRLLSQSNPPTFCAAGTAMGEIERLKSTTATPAACTGHPQALVLIKAMRNYGLMVTDNGMTGGVVATADSRWNSDDLSCLSSLKLSDFEPVNVSSKMIDINSSRVRP